MNESLYHSEIAAVWKLYCDIFLSEANFIFFGISFMIGIFLWKFQIYLPRGKALLIIFGTSHIPYFVGNMGKSTVSVLLMDLMKISLVISFFSIAISIGNKKIISDKFSIKCRSISVIV